MSCYEGILITALFVGIFSFFGGMLYGMKDTNGVEKRLIEEKTELNKKHDEEIKSIQRDSDYWKEKFNAEIRK